MRFLLIFLAFSANAQISLKTGGLFPFVTQKSITSTFYEVTANYKYVGIEYNQGFMNGYADWRYQRPSYVTNYKLLGATLNLPIYQFSQAYYPFISIGGGYMFIEAKNQWKRYDFKCQYVSLELANRTIISDHLDLIIGVKYFITQTKYLDSYPSDSYDHFITINSGISFKF